MPTLPVGGAEASPADQGRLVARGGGGGQLGAVSVVGEPHGLLRRVFKDYFRWHVDLRQSENWFLGLTVGMKTGCHAGVGRNAD